MPASSDGAVSDGAVSDGAVSDGAVFDGAVRAVQAITLTGDLHARPAGALAVAAARFASVVSVSAGARTVDAKSVLSVMGLGATSGQEVTVVADGPDAREAVTALISILSEATRLGS
jgi:phosphocarrier protein HPr